MVGGGELRHRFTGESRELLGCSGHPEPEALQLGRTAHRADDRPLLSGGGGDEHAVALHHQPLPVFGSNQLAAHGAGQHDRPALPIQHRQHRARRPNQLGDPIGEEPTSAGLVSPPVDHLDDRPPRPLGRTGRRRHPVTGGLECSERRSRRDQRARHVGPGRPLDGDISGVPGGVSLLLERFVVFVDHHDPGERRHPGPHRRSGAEHEATPAGGGGPVAGMQPHRQPSTLELAGETGGLGGSGGDHDGVAVAGERGDHVAQRGGGGHPDDGRLGRRCRPARSIRPTRSGERADIARRRRRSQQRCHPTGPAAGRPLREIDQLRRGPNRGHPSDRLRNDTGGRRDTDLRQPAGDPAAVELDPDDRPDLDSRRQVDRHEVVECLVQARHVGLHTNDDRAVGQCGLDGIWRCGPLVEGIGIEEPTCA